MKYIGPVVLALLVVFGACSGGGPRQPKAATIPAGNGWSCMPTGGVRMCQRVQNDCNVQSFQLGKGNASPCVAATVATCVTYTQDAKDKVDCFAENKTCNEYRNFLAGKFEEVANTISVCRDMP